MAMSTFDILKMFWKDWNNHDPQYYKVFVGIGIDEVQYKEITGVDYTA